MVKYWWNNREDMAMKLGNFENKQTRAPQTIPLSAGWDRDNGETQVYWLGAAGVLVNCRGTVVMIDPVLSITSDDPAVSEIGEPLLVAPPIEASAVGKLDAVLYTHADNDHLGPLTAQALARTGARYRGTPRVLRELDALGIPTAQTTAHAAGDRFAVSAVQIEVTPALHPHQLGNADFTDYFGPDDCCGYKLTTPDGVLWVPGDTMLLREHLRMTDVDLLFIDFSDDHWHWGREVAISLANLLTRTELIAFHYGTFHGPEKPHLNADPESLRGRLRRPERLHVLAPGEKFVLGKTGQ